MSLFVTLTVKVTGAGRDTFAKFATICVPVAFTVGLNAMAVGVGLHPSADSSTSSPGAKFAPRIVKVKLFPGARLAGERLGGVTWVISGTGVGGGVWPKLAVAQKQQRRVSIETPRSSLLVRMNSLQEGISSDT